MTREEETAVIERAKAGDESAKTELYQRHLGMIITIVRQYTRKGADEADATSVAHITFVKAIEQFDPSRDIRFITYLTTSLIRNVRRADIGGPIAKAWNSPRQLPSVASFSYENYSGGRAFGDTIPDNRSPDPLSSDHESGFERERQFAVLITLLKPQEQKAMVGKYIGLEPSDIARHMGVSRQRVHQIQGVAMDKLIRLGRSPLPLKPEGNPDENLRQLLFELTSFPRTIRRARLKRETVTA